MKSATENRKPYGGLVRSLVIAIDVGTTFSGVSYAILEPGEIPKIHGVTRFPGQEHVAGNTKIPSVIYYDKYGKMMAAGAEADTTSVVSQAEDEGWIKTELFKLRLRPRTMQLNMNGMRLGPLPRRKTAVHVFGDFLAYLYRCTRNFITDTHGNGAALWNAVEHDIQFVLSHPNGWEGAQQTKMRRSAVYGGLVPDTDEGKARIRFVTEGEASLHACVLNGLAADVLSNPSQNGFLIADAGGGTLDISAYAIRGTTPLVMEEIAPPDCIFAGSVFVSRRAREFLEEKLKGSKYGTPAALDHITQRFDETTKRLFRDTKDLQFIPFGSPLDKDLAVGIRGGQLKLTGNEVANLFEPSVDAAFNAIKAQIEASNGIIRSVFLVGGYAASPWLFTQLQERLAPLSVMVSRPDTQTSKAVADGAIGFYCDHHVSARMSKFMYGVEFLRELNPRDPDHIARKERLCELPSGPKLLPDAFDCILNRSVKVKESTVFTRKYCTELTSLSMLSVFEVEIWCYRGGNVVPKWINRQADDFSTLCVVRADLSPLSSSAEPKVGKNGKTYWTIVFSIEIHFGLTEFKARLKWVDDGKTRHGPASIIYNERGHRADEDEPDTYPEDDAGPYSPRNDRLRSEPASRARTPIEQFYPPPGGSENKDTLVVEPLPEVKTPEVHHDQTILSRGLSPASTSFPTDMVADITPNNEMQKDIIQDKKKGKGKDKIPKSTPKSENLSSPSVTTLSAKTPKLGDTLSSSWGSANPPPESLSPITSPTETKPPQFDFGSSSPSQKEKEKNSLIDVISTKPSPAINANRSPLGATEPIVAPEIGEAPVAPSVTPTQKVTAASKKSKKKGVSAATTPVLESTPEVPSTAPPTQTISSGSWLDDEKTKNTPEAAIITSENPPVSTEKSASPTPAVLPEAIYPNIFSVTAAGAELLAPLEGTASTLFASSTWDKTGDGWGDSTNKDGFDSWNTLSATPKTPKSRESPKTPQEVVSKADGISPKPSSPSNPPWGASTAPVTKTSGAGLSWGKSTLPTSKTPEVKSSWGASASNSTWGASPNTSATKKLSSWDVSATAPKSWDASDSVNESKPTDFQPTDIETAGLLENTTTPGDALNHVPVITETPAAAPDPNLTKVTPTPVNEEISIPTPDAEQTTSVEPKTVIPDAAEPETPMDVVSPGGDDAGDDDGKDKDDGNDTKDKKGKGASTPASTPATTGAGKKKKKKK